MLKEVNKVSKVTCKEQRWWVACIGSSLLSEFEAIGSAGKAR